MLVGKYSPYEMIFCIFLTILRSAYHEVNINNIKLYELFCVNLTFYLETSLTINRNISGIHGHCHGHGCPSLYIEHFYLVLIIYILSSEKPLVLIIGCPKLQW